MRELLLTVHCRLTMVSNIKINQDKVVTKMKSPSYLFERLCHEKVMQNDLFSDGAAAAAAHTVHTLQPSTSTANCMTCVITEGGTIPVGTM